MRRGGSLVLSSTRDDAAGEALDKGDNFWASVIPAGRSSEKLAASGTGDAFDFPAASGGATN